MPLRFQLGHNQTPDELATWFDLSLAQVHAALAYYYGHKEVLDAEIKQRREEAVALKEQRVGSYLKIPVFPDQSMHTSGM